ncbi:MAG: hypothetical protein J6Y28_03345 [Acholeplasmatales bacterium]|nr:hypothetical protein [Acholeplasmatales bacterium]
MVKKIEITYFDGRLGPEYIHWEEKMTITRDRVTYKRKDYHKIDNDNYVPVESSWKYIFNKKIDIYVERQDFNHLEILANLITDLSDICGCGADIGSVEMTVYYDDGTKVKKRIFGSLSMNNNTQLKYFLESLIPNDILEPYFL